MFTARNRQNPFAERKRREAQRRAAEAAAAPATPSPESPVAEPAPTQVRAVPHERNPESAEYAQTPDISKFAEGGVVPQTTVEDVVVGGQGPESVVPLSHPAVQDAVQAFQRPVEISPETQAKIDAVVNHAIAPVAEEPYEPQYVEIESSGPEGHSLGLGRETTPVLAEQIDEPKRGRGRPRPQETIDRDNAVHALLVSSDAGNGISKEAIGAELGEKEQQVYSSLRQLSKEGRAETRYVKPHGYRWFATGEGN